LAKRKIKLVYLIFNKNFYATINKFFNHKSVHSPWPCRDIKSLLRNIKTTPVRFPYSKPIGNQTKDFLMKCLELDESKRIGWDQIFKHKMLKSTGIPELPPINLDEKT